jgi:hypothetical protein
VGSKWAVVLTKRGEECVALFRLGITPSLFHFGRMGSLILGHLDLNSDSVEFVSGTMRGLAHKPCASFVMLASVTPCIIGS